jgi:hypothetical protein
MLSIINTLNKLAWHISHRIPPPTCPAVLPLIIRLFKLGLEFLIQIPPPLP